MSETPLPLPTGLRWIKIVCRLGRLAHDGADTDDKPDLLPTAGKVRLTSSPARLRVQETDGRWRSVAMDDREYTIRADGELVDIEGRVGVWIPDPASALLDPRPYTLVSTVTPMVGDPWTARITGENLPDVVDLVAHSETVAIPASAVPGLSSRIASVEGILADGGGGVDVGPSHESILATGNVTLPTEHPVLTIRADDPATLSIPEAPDGTVITAHVVYGWENITWAPGIVVQGETSTTETWLVLVRSEGEWKVLVSGESADSGDSGSGGGSIAGLNVITGSWPPPLPAEYPVGTLYVRDPQEFDGPVMAVKDYRDWRILAGDDFFLGDSIDRSAFTPGIGEVVHAGWSLIGSRGKGFLYVRINSAPEPGDILCTLDFPALTDFEQNVVLQATLPYAGVLTVLGSVEGENDSVERVGIYNLTIEPYKGIKYLWPVAGAPLTSGVMLEISWPATIPSQAWGSTDDGGI